MRAISEIKSERETQWPIKRKPIRRKHVSTTKTNPISTSATLGYWLVELILITVIQESGRLLGEPSHRLNPVRPRTGTTKSPGTTDTFAAVGMSFVPRLASVR